MREREEINTAILHSAKAPTKIQERRFRSYLAKKYGREMELVWNETGDYGDGFRLEVGAEVYEWTQEGRFEQLRETLQALPVGSENIIPLLRETVHDWTPKAIAHEVGTVLTVGDGIATVSGLAHATYGEILLFAGGARGMVQELRADEIGCILFDDDESIGAGSAVRRTGRTAGVPVGEPFLGRVVDPLGVPLDELGEIKTDEYRPIERPAPGIVDRQPVNAPMETGFLAIDSMFPIGRGQRELIIGDRQTGKTAIAVDAILNQKGKDVICIYVAIGQKASSVAQLVHNLRTRGAMEFTIVVSAPASASAPLQYIAPYAGCALGEYFMERGDDVLIVYDDLSKHAVAYRSMSLLLERPPGREAYPGDVFYLHSRLLERAAHLSDEKGGGSMTALPIVETQAGDVSAYIPTNIISITDGQLFLESDLFFAGQRPAVNIGLSVSRVGGDAQTAAMKKATGSLRLDLAQYREMEVFTQFSSDLDDATRIQLIYGESLMRILRQEQYRPLAMHEQVILLVAALGHLFQEIEPGRIPACAREMVAWFSAEQAGLCSHIEESGTLADGDKEMILAAGRRFMDAYDKGN